MPLVCPKCSGSLRITHSLELPPDSRSDEITLQVIQCSQCSFAGIGVYEESRRGALDDESFDHTGYSLPAKELSALKAAMRRCPHSRDPRCTCDVHRRYGERDESGRWVGVRGLSAHSPFRLALS